MSRRTLAELASEDLPFTTGDAAKFFNVDPRTVARWIRDDKIETFTTPGGHHRIPYREILRLAKKRGLVS